MGRLYKINDYELLSKKVYRVLKTRIIKGGFKPGEKILETNIARQLGVSRTPVREALRMLASEGFVRMEANLGVIVIDFSLEDLQEVLQIRKLLEGFATSLAAKRISETEIKQLDKTLEKMSNSIAKEDVLAYSDANAEFHDLIFNICGNKKLTRIYDSLSSADHRFRIRALRNNSNRLKYSLQEHQEIVKALKKRDSDQAERLSQRHIENVWQNILKQEVKEEETEQNA